MVKRKKWTLRPQADSQDRQSFSKEIQSSEIFANLCLQRGINKPKDLDRFIHPTLEHLHDPYLFYDMDRAVDRISQAIIEGEKITIYGDYDADGVTATSLLLENLRLLGADVDFYIPDRFKEGYGPNPSAFKQLIDEGTQVIITCDNGIQGHESIELAQELGVDVIITDHHHIPEELPTAYAIIHPAHPQGDYPFKDLAGVGVAFKLAHAILEEAPLESLDLVAIGTVADLVSLTDENHLMVKYGLQLLRQNTRFSLQALYEVSHTDYQTIDETTIAFRLAPRLNAVGRMSHASTAVHFLLSEDYQQAEALAQKMETFNQERRQLTDQVAEEAFEKIQDHDRVNLVAGESWHEGILGIVASRLVEKTDKPSLVFSLDTKSGLAKGSGRSSGDFDFIRSLEDSNSLFEAYGGHQAAAGMTIKIENLEKLRNNLNHYVEDHYQEEDLLDELLIDMPLKIEDVKLDLIEEMKQLQPYGMSNPSPLFLFKDYPAQQLKKIGSDKKHLKFVLSSSETDLDCIAFNFGSLLDHLGDQPQLDIVGHLNINEWNGIKKVQILVEDIRSPHLQVIDKRSINKKEAPLVDDSNLAYLVFNEKYYRYLLKTRNLSDQIYHVSNIKNSDELKIKESKWVFLDMPRNEQQIKDLLSKGGYSHLYAIFKSFENAYLEGLAKREDFAKVYKHLASHKNIDTKKRDALASYLDMSVNFLNHIIFIFIELGYVTIQEGILELNPKPQAVDLEASRIYQERKELMKLEEKLIYSSSSELTQYLEEWSQGEQEDGSK